jgi:hypothetical protein
MLNSLGKKWNVYFKDVSVSEGLSMLAKFV